MTTGVVVLVVSCVLALALGGYRLATDGRFRGTHTVRGIPPESEQHELTTWDQLATAARVPPGERATLVQFSSAFCAPCRATRRTLHDVAALVPGVVHVEIDAEHHLEVVRALGIMRTPTTIVVGADGHEVTRATGAPTKQQVLAALAQ
jgi:thiol-disulfide isomerase/thioredoxin